jgi:ATP-binding cassette subfamily B protein
VPITILVSDFLQPYIVAQILQIISDGSYDKGNLLTSFGPLVLAYSAATIASGVVGWRLNNYLVWNLELNVTRDIARRVFSHLVNLDTTFHDNTFAGSLVSQTNKLLGSYIRFQDATIFNLYTLVISVVAAIVILTPFVPLYSVAILLLSLIYIIGAALLSKKVRIANTEEAKAQNEQTGYLADSISNIVGVKSFSNVKYEEERFDLAVNKVRNAGLNSMRRTTVRELFASTITSGIGIASVLLAIFGSSVAGLDLAILFLVVSYTAAIGHRLWDFQNVLRQYNRALGDASSMVETLGIEPSIKDPKQPEESRITRGSIMFKDVTFAHESGENPLFNKFNLRIKQGEKIGLVGHSGSGKTSLTKLLLRFSDIQDGSIAIDGQDITSITQSELRSHIAYVPQEPLLFHRTLAENIAYSEPNATQKEMEGVAKLANAHEFIEKLSGGYETLVGERGVKLSGGQRQRVAIARAMLKNSPILLLDEATSALDSESESLIQEALWRLMQNRTAIVIAHRLSTIQKMDRIIVLDEGKIVEQGTHKELLHINGTYARLWSHQSGGFMED